MSRVFGKITRGGKPILGFIAFLLTSFSKIYFIPPPPFTLFCVKCVYFETKSTDNINRMTTKAEYGREGGREGEIGGESIDARRGGEGGV